MADPTSEPSRAGRQRDPLIDEAVMTVALEHLSRNGIGGFSIAAVASDAGTTRPAIYRRWNGKIDLLIAAVAWLASTEPPTRTGRPYADLVREMQHFRHCISHVGALSLAGVMLTDGVEEPIRSTYHEQIAHPRWRRLGETLLLAVDLGELPGDADIELGTSLLTGSWYAFAWSGRDPGEDWPERVVAATWRALGGTPEAGLAAAVPGEAAYPQVTGRED